MFELRQYFLLFLTATIWGSGFVAQKLGVTAISPFAFTFFRTFIGGLCLLPIIYFNYKRRHQMRYTSKKMVIYGGICCGFFLIIAESFQQYGLRYTDVNKASFITALYMIFVPIIGIFMGHKINKKIVLCVAISTIGLYLFCMKPSSGYFFQIGDLLELICAILFAFHILVIAYFINHVDGVLLSCTQFFAASFMGLILMLVTEIPTYQELSNAFLPLIYVGIMSNGIAYTLQVVAQRGISPTIASLILSLESVMGAIFGVCFLSETMTERELCGAALMFVAVILTQVKIKKL